MSNPTQTKDSICSGCQVRTCCYHYKVTITGFDMWRISRTLDLPPNRFAAYLEAEPESEESFLLDQGGTRFEMVLAKMEEGPRFGGCVFLARTNDATHRCGLGELRPDQCRLYPAYFHEGLARVINDPRGCWRTWSVCELDLEREQQRSSDYEQHRAEYRQILAQWNQRVWQSGEREYGFHEFCNYLENRYAELYPPA